MTTADLREEVRGIINDTIHGDVSREEEEIICCGLTGEENDEQLIAHVERTLFLLNYV